MKRNLIIDSRIRKEEYEYLKQFFEIKKLPLSEDVYEEISGHSDIFYFENGDKIICAPNAIIKDDRFIIGNKKVEKDYPNDVKYNACKIDKYIIGSEYTDKSIPVDIKVRQGYVKCSIAITGGKSCITSDEWIAKKLIMNGIDALYIQENNIKLLDKNGDESNKNGFIGGASLAFDNKFVLFGDINYLSNRDKVIEHLEKYNLQLIDFKGLSIYDYGGGIIY